jgi:hypothetical protein
VLKLLFDIYKEKTNKPGIFKLEVPGVDSALAIA